MVVLHDILICLGILAGILLNHLGFDTGTLAAINFLLVLLMLIGMPFVASQLYVHGQTPWREDVFLVLNYFALPTTVALWVTYGFKTLLPGL